MYIYLLKYNNYYNRKFKLLPNNKLIRESSTDDSPYYSDYLVSNTITQGIFSNINFIPGDGINTEIDKNWNGEEPDYLITSIDGSTVDSRWFIIHSYRTRQGQYKYKLLRDVMADYWDNIKGAPVFIEKALLPDSNPLIYNQEDMTFNQIKQGPDYLIKDETNVPWICGYFVPGKEMTATTAGSKYDRVIAGIENDPYYQYTNSDFMAPPSRYSYQICGHGMKTTSQSGDQTGVVITVGPYDKNNKAFKKGDNVFNGIFNDFYSDSVSNSQEYPTYFNYTFKSSSNYYFWDYQIEIWNKLKTYETTLFNAIKSYIPYNTQAEYNSLVNATNDIIYDSTNQKYYKMRIVSQGNKTVSKLAPGTIASTFINANIFTISGIEKSHNNKYPSGINENRSIGVTATVPAYRVVYDEVQGDSISLTIPATSKKVNDAPYGIFAMPYGILDIYDGTTKKCTTNPDIQMNMATELFRKYGAGDGKILYDLTLMPYCPCRSAIMADGKFNISDYDVYYLNKENTNVGVAIMAKYSTFSLSITKQINITNKKIQNQTDIYRIVSPNYDGQFEFNLTKNNGLEGFNIDCTYRPFQPYVQVAPIFNNLYGSDWQDARGLICGGDFSIPVLSNAWESYQLSNKNYQRIFNRQIENMEVNNKYQLIQQRVGALAGSLGAGVGAGLGLSALNPLAGLIGGASASLLSLGAGIADTEILKKLQAESIDFSKDLFGYQLGNIQALPNSLAKVGSFTANNKIFPFLEYYTCTDTEKIAFANKIKYNSMTVMTIGTINEYLNNTWSYNEITANNYIKGQLINIDIDGDYDLTNQIASEISRGVYFNEYTSVN